jgi:hypothetical protein
MDESPGPILTGSHGSYLWLTNADDHMGTLVQSCPEVILGRYLAVTSIDSGTPWLTETQKNAGWVIRAGVAYSQKVQPVDQLNYQRDGLDSPGYDEWYVFEQRTDLGEVSMNHPFIGSDTTQPDQSIVFVNYPFTISSPDPFYSVLRKFFWEQLERLQPESYIADGRDCLTFVTRDVKLFEIVRQRLARSA